MSLEKSIQILTDEIKQFNAALKENSNIFNALLRKISDESFIPKKKLLTEIEAAEYIGVSRSFLSQDRMNGHRTNRLKGPNPIKIGKKILYDLKELNEWLKTNQITR